MALRTRKIVVNFYQITPNPLSQATPINFARLKMAFEALDTKKLADQQRSQDYILNPEGIKIEKGMLIGSLNNGQTGGIMPLRRGPNGQYNSAIEPGERLGHPCCFVYDIASSILLLESLPKGASPSDWCHYFKAHLYDSPNITWSIIEKRKSEDLLKDLKYITNFEISVAGYRKDDLFKEQAPNHALGEITDLAIAGQASVVNCGLSTEVRKLNKKRKRPEQESLDKGFIQRTLDKINGEPEVRKLSISGLHNEDDAKVDIINLLEFRLQDVLEIPITELSAENLNLAIRVIRLRELYDKHGDILARYKPNDR